MKEWIIENFMKGSEYESLLSYITIEWNRCQLEDLNELLNNKFYTDAIREAILNVFYMIQKCNHAITRLKRTFRLKRAILYNTDDLYMNPISPTDKNVIVLLQNNTKYVFHIRELIQSINSSLSHCCHFFPSSIVCKNPYTNLPFNKSALYNIYFAIKESTYLMPILFHNYFLCNFNYHRFCMENDEAINEEYLKTYLENSCAYNVFVNVVEMFEMHNMKCNIHITFPADQLYTIMKPYLKLHFFSNFSINKLKKRHAFRKLHRKLHSFVQYNPNFGRRKVRLTPLQPFSEVKRCTYFYNDKHVPFIDTYERDSDILTFMTSHLEECNEPMNPIVINIINEEVGDNENVIEDSDSDDDPYHMISMNQYEDEDEDEDEDDVLEEDEMDDR